MPPKPATAIESAKKPKPATTVQSTKEFKPAIVIQPTTKPPLVLVHGFRGSPCGLEAIAKDLRQAGYDVHTPAVPPFAGAKLQDYTPKTYARHLRDYIKEQKLVRPVLIGHSMGSIVVTATAKRYPELTNQKLILLSPISTKPPKTVAQISPLANYLPGKVVDYITTKFLFVKDKKQSRDYNQKLFQETMQLTHECSGDRPPKQSELSGAMKFSTGYSVADFLDGLQKDLMLIAGAEDRLISQKDTRELTKKYDAVLEFIPNSGHLHNYEKPHETAKLILKMLK